MSVFTHTLNTASNIAFLGEIRSRVWVEAEKATAPLRVEVAVEKQRQKLMAVKSALAQSADGNAEDLPPWQF